jgi:CRISPR/Cas system-associated exonuclease Cas4 (RecB family)
MSISTLLASPLTRVETREILDDLVPEYRRNVSARPVVNRSCRHPQFVGIAFDYAARMELRHLAPHAAGDSWVADVAVEMLPRASKEKRTAARVVRAARQAAKEWAADAGSRHREIARQAAKLCQLDQVLRAGLGPTFGEVDGVDERGIAVETEMLLNVSAPLLGLAHRGPLSLNPNFGIASLLVGGADADLISGDTLIEIKTTQAGVIERDHMRQLVAYACLAHAAGISVRSVGVYLSRHSVLCEVPLNTRDPDAAYSRAFGRLAELWELHCSRAPSDVAATRLRVA